METKIFKDVELYKDNSFRKRWSEVFGGDLYKVEVKGRKARVHAESVFSPRPSRFNTLSYVGGNSEKNYFQLTVNGNKVYFAINYSLI